MTLVIGVEGKERGLILGADPAFGDLLGFPPGSLIDRAVADLVHPDSHDEVGRQLARVVGRECRRFGGVFRVPDADGELRWLSFHACLTAHIEPEQLLLRVFALPVRLPALDSAQTRRKRSRDWPEVELDLAHVAHGNLAMSLDTRRARTRRIRPTRLP